MKIETAFDVNNLVQRKFDTITGEQVSVLEVMEITSNTCYAGTQVFYACRLIMLQKKFNMKKEMATEYEIGHGVARRDGEIGWIKYREDELIPAKDEFVNIILGK